MTEVERIDNEIGNLTRKIEGWQKELESKQAHREKMEKKRKSLRSKTLRGADQRAQRELTDLRQVLGVLDLEIEDLESEIRDSQTEIKEQLQPARAVAYREKCWAERMQEAEKALKEAEQMAAYWDGFEKLIKPHRETLARITYLSQEAGRPRSIDMRSMWRCLDARLHALDPVGKPFSYSAYKSHYSQPYSKVLGEALKGTAQPDGSEEKEVRSGGHKESQAEATA